MILSNIFKEKISTLHKQTYHPSNAISLLSGMAEELRNLTKLLLDGATIKVEDEIIEKLKEELTSFECLMCCRGFESFEEFQRHQDEHAASQSNALQVFIVF